MAITPGGRVGDDSPFSASRTSNWVARAGGLPTYIREVAHALVRSGHDESRAIEMAVGIVRDWAEGKGNVRPQVRAGAAKAIAEWEAKKASAHSMANDDGDVIELSNAATLHARLRKHYPPHVLSWVRSAKVTHRQVKLADIHMQPRPGKPHDERKVIGMRRDIRAGRPLKPVVLVNTGKGKLKIADGYHRTRALSMEGKTHTEAYVATVRKARGPWSRAMHDAKLNT